MADRQIGGTVQMSSLTIYQFHGNNITFNKDTDTFINATEMARPFSKAPAEFLRLPSTIKFLEALVNMGKSHNELYQTVRGGSNSGTWMHEDLALEFARWLSPSFAIWCNDRIKELLKTGKTEIKSNAEIILQAMNLLQAEVKDQKVRIQLQENTIQQQAPKVQYYDQVLNSNSTFNTNVIAKEKGISAITLNRILQEKRIIYKQGGTYLLFQKYQDKDLAKTRTHTFSGANGEPRTSIQLVWTEKGREFIHSLIQKI